ncbi:MAG: VOC family protein [Candidatus Andeanibacterium colombiense]|uniref:VOC family protein n=1 Tax=Candidatus Andeanibacterium colombiense TaxID=3121345 RepID=A0AAJ5X851_9SPHN|nr:MAG: VOC family protein [Sphingomonadaceae bacterium]
MAGAPIWFELMTPDVAAAIPFYKAVGGWQIQTEGILMPNGTEYRMIARSDGGNLGGLLKLTEGMIAGGAAPGWLAYFHVEDVEASVTKAQELGATVHMPPTAMSAGTMAMIADPQGAPFYLMKPTPPPGQPDAKSDVFDGKKAGHCRWMQLDTTDAPAANEFYKALFGWNTERTMPMGEHGDYRFIENDGMPIGAFNPMIAPGQQPAWQLYLGVEDIERARGAVLAQGGAVTRDVHEVPGGDWIFMGKDPSGAGIAFVGSKGAG